MARIITLEANRTYATKANAIKAVEKKYPSPKWDHLTYIIVQDDAGRYFPLFIGERAIQAGVHFHFSVTA